MKRKIKPNQQIHTVLAAASFIRDLKGSGLRCANEPPWLTVLVGSPAIDFPNAGVVAK